MILSGQFPLHRLTVGRGGHQPFVDLIGREAKDLAIKEPHATGLIPVECDDLGRVETGKD